MTRFREARILLKILLPVLFILVIGISPRPHEYTRQMHLAASALEDGRLSAAAKHFAQAAEFAPDRLDLWEPAGFHALASGDPQLAIQAFSQAAQIGPLSTDAQLALGDAYMANGDTAFAIDSWRQGLPDQRAYDRLIDTYLSQKDYASAVQALQELLAYQPDLAAEEYQTGLLLAALEPDSAIPYLERAAALDTGLYVSATTLRDAIRTARLFEEPAYTHVSAGQVLANLGEWELAVISFQIAVELRPDYAEAWAYLGEARQHLPDVTPGDLETLRVLETAVMLDPDSLSANLFLASYYRRNQEYENATVYLRAAAQIEPGNTLVLSDLGATLSESGDLNTALAVYQSIVEMKPDEPVSWRLLAEFCVANKIQVHEIGLPAARNAVMLAPDDASSLDVLGSVFLELEDMFNAERTLLRSIEANPSYSPAHLHLGMYYLLQNDYESALKELEQAIALDPAGVTAHSAMRIMEKYFPSYLTSP